MRAETKRQNFNVTPEQEAELEWLRTTIAAPTMKDAILRAVRLLATLAREIRRGRRLYLGTGTGDLTEVLIPDLETPHDDEWEYLVSRPHPWRRQLYVKGRNLRAFTVWIEMQTNGLTPEEAAESWDLPLDAVSEIVRYCDTHRDLLRMEADEERRRLIEEGIPLGPTPARG